MDKKQYGAGGEDTAAKYLKKLGYKIVERNHSTKLGEIDLIALDRATWVFAEVKTRSGDSFGLPRESVTKQKRRKYSMLAMQYIKQNNLSGQPARFDVIDILDGVVTHIINAFDYEGY